MPGLPIPVVQSDTELREQPPPPPAPQYSAVYPDMPSPASPTPPTPPASPSSPASPSRFLPAALFIFLSAIVILIIYVLVTFPL